MKKYKDKGLKRYLKLSEKTICNFSCVIVEINSSKQQK